MALARRKKVPPTKYEILDGLLFNYGKNLIDKDRFWREMDAHRFGQVDIDWWCREYYAKEEAKQQKPNPYGDRIR